MPIHLCALQWSRVQDLRDVEPLNEADLACMRELREVLARHGCLRRFALHLVHKHFDLAAHEVLVEYCDPIAREQHLRVERRESATARSAMPTTWMLEEDRALVTCVCVFRGSQGHLGRHESV